MLRWEEKSGALLLEHSRAQSLSKSCSEQPSFLTAVCFVPPNAAVVKVHVWECYREAGRAQKGKGGGLRGKWAGRHFSS